ncbi:hypothetical protein NIES4071_62110 [Calothrix sp. NIES-4071]|nr:hypothetical protein NIES4071_62110 [Calothrix sp. NIES-4071]BAZ60515.1 hypothetical protein NIES4105_62060 [Calothrix sp. NIES-4105]
MIKSSGLFSKIKNYKGCVKMAERRKPASRKVSSTSKPSAQKRPLARRTSSASKVSSTGKKTKESKETSASMAPEEEVTAIEDTTSIPQTEEEVTAIEDTASIPQTEEEVTAIEDTTSIPQTEEEVTAIEDTTSLKTTTVLPTTSEPVAPAAKEAPKTKSFGMFLQDPSLPKLRGNYKFPLDKDYLIATGSSRFTIRDTNEGGQPVFASPDWSKQEDLSFEHFEQNGLIDNPAFHQVNVFGVLSRTLDLVEEEVGHPIVWKDGGPLIIRPHAFEGMNAYYDPMNPSLNFGYFNSPFRRAPVWTCLSHDIVSHELGHAILDTFRPLYLYSSDIDTSALHESFADILAMFAALQYPSVVEYIYRQTGGDMRHPSLISGLAEEFGIGIYGAGVPYLRSALEGAKYSPSEPKEPHVRSTIWTAAIYEIMQKLVSAIEPDGFDDTTEGFAGFINALVKATHALKGMLIRALHYTPPTSLSMPMLARLIYEADARVYPTDSKFRDIAKEVFVARNLWNEKIDLKAPDIGNVFRDLQSSDTRTLMRAIAHNAPALRIPETASRFIKPRLITTTRRIDKVKQGEESTIKEITEHYLEYTYEYSQMVSDFLSGGMSAFTVYGGGTLVMDENWNAVCLAAYPEPVQEDPAGAEGGKAAWKRAREQFDKIHGGNIQRTIAAKDENRSLNDRPVVPGCPFVIQSTTTGGYRLVRRCCNLHEHIKGISVSQNGLADF